MARLELLALEPQSSGEPSLEMTSEKHGRLLTSNSPPGIREFFGGGGKTHVCGGSQLSSKG